MRDKIENSEEDLSKFFLALSSAGQHYAYTEQIFREYGMFNIIHYALKEMEREHPRVVVSAKTRRSFLYFINYFIILGLVKLSQDEDDDVSLSMQLLMLGLREERDDACDKRIRYETVSWIDERLTRYLVCLKSGSVQIAEEGIHLYNEATNWRLLDFDG